MTTPHQTAIGDIRIGISGWRYKGWRGKFYTPKLLQRSELHYAAQTSRSIEINGTGSRTLRRAKPAAEG